MPKKRGREALPGGLTLRDLEQLLRSELQGKFATGEHQYLYIRDLTDEWVIYELEGSAVTNPGCFKATYAVGEGNVVTMSAPVEVAQRTVYEVKEARDTHPGRVLEAKGSDDAGGRIFRVEIIRYGESKNGKLYPAKVMKPAARLYEGSKAFDHHRTDEELKTSTLAGLVGYYRNVEATDVALEGDLHLLPSATRVVEALEASLAAQADGLDPIVGVSHDVGAWWKPVIQNGKRLQEATQIVGVNSADIVAHPAAGGRVTRMVAGGSGDLDPKEESMTLEQLRELLSSASPEEKAALASDLGLPAPAAPAATEPVTTVTPPAATDPAGDAKPELVGAAAESATFARESFLGKLAVRTAIEDAKLDTRLVEAVTKQLPERFTEADLGRYVETAKSFAAGLESAGLTPKVKASEVTADELDKKRKALDAMLEGNFKEGYRSLKTAYRDIVGADWRSLDDHELPFAVLRESFGGGRHEGQRTTESIDTASWGEVFGDSITRRMIKMYNLPQLADWRRIVSDIAPVNDFRTQRRARVGGYGTLPVVGQSGVYQPLTSPTDEEVTYAIEKRGGTEDLTLEAIANDDLQAVRRIPDGLARAAAQTLYRFVFDFLTSSANIYDSDTLFAAGHNNTDAASALTQATLSVGRRKMREQTAYGNTSEVLGATPKYLITPPELEEVAFQLVRSAVAIPSSGNASNIPNIHQGLEHIVVDYFSDANDWYIVADPALTPTIEMGFYGGREEPELFVQDDPRAGATFNADKVTYKIRHIYKGAVLDYRGFYRGQG